MTYKEFIEECKNKKIPDKYQKHHIIPKCLGGTDEKENIIKLSYEDHWIAHQLLMTENPECKELNNFHFKMSLEDWIGDCENMAKKRDYHPFGELNPFYGKHHTEETRKRISKNSSGKNNGMYGVHRQGENAPTFGKIWSDEERHNASEAQKRLNKHWYTNGIDNKLLMGNDIIPEGFYKGRTLNDNRT